MTTIPNIIPVFIGFCSCKTGIHHVPVNKMVPIDRFNLDHARIKFLTDDEYDVQGCTSAVGGRKPGAATEEVLYRRE